jgi:hypothetical protein
MAPSSLSDGEVVGEFWFVRVDTDTKDDRPVVCQSSTLTRSSDFLANRITVIHFYDGNWGGCRPCAAQMDVWSKRYHPHVQFICICVESLSVAQMFSRIFLFTKCWNAYIPNRQYFPKNFGQLGCSGFIVIQNNRFISKKTRSYLDYGEYAFVDVEQLIDSPTPPSLRSHNDNEDLPGNDDDTPEAQPLLAAIEAPPLTGIGEMDREHQDCTRVLNQLLNHPADIEAWQRAVRVLAEHFIHEEETVLKLKCDAAESPFSPLHSHKKDHERILDIGRQEIERDRTLSSSWHSCHPRPEKARALATAFVAHATDFDALYSEHG